MNKLTTRQKQAIETKLKIINVTFELFQSFDKTEVTIKDICEKANISVGAFYHHFKSKDEIINVTIDTLDILLLERLDKYNFKNSYESIYIFFNEVCNVIKENIGHTLISYMYSQQLTSKTKHLLSLDRISYKKLLSYITIGIKNEELIFNKPPQEIATTLLRVARSIVIDWCLQEGSYDLNKIMLVHFEILLPEFGIINKPI